MQGRVGRMYMFKETIAIERYLKICYTSIMHFLWCEAGIWLFSSMWIAKDHNMIEQIIGPFFHSYNSNNPFHNQVPSKAYLFLNSVLFHCPLLSVPGPVPRYLDSYSLVMCLDM